jgi:hypothetical protein
MKTKIINGYEYTIKDEQKDKSFNEIVIPKGWKLWSISDIESFTLEQWNKLNLKDCWFFIKYPFICNPNNYVARFYVGSYRAYLNCIRDPTYHNPSLGVRFCREVKK